MESKYDGSQDQYTVDGQSIARCAMPVVYLGDEENEIHRPDIDKIHEAGKTKKSWTQLQLFDPLVTAVLKMGYKKPLPMERILITAAQERCSVFVSGSSGKLL
jgi:hypothetical protein